MENLTAIMIDGLVYLVLLVAIIKGFLVVLNTVFEFTNHTAREQHSTSIVLKLGFVSVLTVVLSLLTGYYTNNFSYFFS